MQIVCGTENAIGQVNINQQEAVRYIATQKYNILHIKKAQ
jgi:hypothetical protein